jgi:transposase
MSAKPSTRLSISRDEIRAIYAQGEEAVIELVEGLVARINALEDRVEALENQLSKTSRNSSKPPSGDGFKKKTKSLRAKSNRPSGGQPGHPGHTLEWSAEVDEIEVHSVTTCAGCGASLSETPIADWEVRQVHDLPPMSLEVREHRCEIKNCPDCGILNRGEFPKEVTQSVQYGVHLQSLIVYLMEMQLLPSQRVCELLSEVCEIEISEGTLYNVRSRCFEALGPAEQEIRQALLEADVVHFDETGFRVKNQLWWLHVACTESLTFYFVHEKRGQLAMDEMGVLPKFQGKGVHDGLKSYFGYVLLLHCLCNAHHLRELIFIAERYEQEWAQEMITLLIEMKRQVDEAKEEGQEALALSQIVSLEQQYFEILKRGVEANPPEVVSEDEPKRRGRRKQSAAKNLLDRLTAHSEAVLRFIHDFAVPFDNNQAERDIRMMKLKLKISGGFRAQSGARMFCRIRGYLSSLRKQGVNIWNALVQIFMGCPISPIPAAE